jgi:putative colanic acid biosynthesis glycosyltransferase
MKIILQINTIVNSGSTGRIAEGIGQEAIANGWESYIAFGRNEQPSQSKLIKIGTDFDIKLHWLKTRIFDRHGFGSKTATINFIERIKELKPDIIHLHNIHGYYLNIEILFNYLAIANIPVVWTLHDCWSYTGHCSYFDFVSCDKWKVECYSCPQKKEYPTSWLLDNSKQNFYDKKKSFNSVMNLTIVPVSNWLSNLLLSSFFKNKNSNLIYNGIDLSVFSPRIDSSPIRNKFSIGNRFMLLGAASLWERRKNLDDFIELSRLINKDTVIVLVGLTDGQQRGLPSNIICISRTENLAMLADLYSAADIVLNLSDEETFGLTTVEGFACGTPGIVYNCTASPELVTSDTGIIVEKGDMHGLFNAISEIETKGKTFYSKACRDRAMKYFNKKDKYKEYVQLYESLLSPIK